MYHRISIAAAVALALSAAAPARAEAVEAKCVVSGKAVAVTEKTPRVLVNGQPQYFCCENCPRAFAKSPEKFLKKIAKCPVQKDEARADVQMRTVVNNNLYYVCCPGCDVTSDPAGTLKKLVDPVTKKEFAVTAKSPRADYMGQIYFFAGPESKAEFGKSPEKYAVIYGK